MGCDHHLIWPGKAETYATEVPLRNDRDLTHLEVDLISKSHYKSDIPVNHHPET